MRFLKAKVAQSGSLLAANIDHQLENVKFI